MAIGLIQLSIYSGILIILLSDKYYALSKPSKSISDMTLSYFKWITIAPVIHQTLVNFVPLTKKKAIYIK